MNFEQYLMEILKEEYEDSMISKGKIDAFDVDTLYKDEDGNYFNSDGEFISAHEKDIFTEELLNSIHMFITKVDVLEEKTIDSLVAYLGTQFYIAHYGKKDSAPALKFLAYSDIKEIVRLFFENEMFGREMLSSFYGNAINPEEFYATKRKIQEDENIKDLDRLYNIAYPPKMYSLNNKLREIICNLYNYYISRGYPDKEALEITWCYFTRDIDPLHEIEELGYSPEQIPYVKRYMLGLIIGDLFEDTANKPLVNTENYDGRMAQVLPVVMASLGVITIPQDPVVRGRMLKYFILLQDNPEKKKSNREKTHSEGREKVLKKVNPAYILDELTF